MIPNKRPKIFDATHKHYISQTALASILEDIAKNDLPTAVSRRSQYTARKNATNIVTPYGRVIDELALPLTTKQPRGPDIESTFILPVLSPAPMLHLFAEESTPFSELLRDTYARKGCSQEHPWRFVLYADEVSPTNPLVAGQDRRKVQGIYWSFFEFGIAALSCEECWFVFTVLRSEICDKFNGGMSRLIRMLLETFMFNSDGFHFSRAGMHVQLKVGGSFHLFVIFDTLIGDGLALKEIACSMSAKGIKFCTMCNVVNKYSTLESRELVKMTCLDRGQIREKTDASMLAIARRLRDQKTVLTGTAFKSLQTQLGMVYNPYMIQLSETLEVRLHWWIMYDWMHIYLIHGIFNIEFGRFEPFTIL